MELSIYNVIILYCAFMHGITFLLITIQYFFFNFRSIYSVLKAGVLLCSLEPLSLESVVSILGLCFFNFSSMYIVTKSKHKTRRVLSETKAIMSPPVCNWIESNSFVEEGEIVN